jgi:hypothetical protein
MATADGIGPPCQEDAGALPTQYMSVAWGVHWMRCRNCSWTGVCYFPLALQGGCFFRPEVHLSGPRQSLNASAEGDTIGTLIKDI